MQTWKFEVTMKVADSWVADGFDGSGRVEEIKEAMQGMLPYAYGHEVQVAVKVTQAPDPKVVTALGNGQREIKD